MSVFAGSIANINNVIVMSYCAWLGWILRGVNMTMKPVFFPPKLGFGLSTCPSAICLSWVISFKELWNQRVRA